jgi:hypothetical protein
MDIESKTIWSNFAKGIGAELREHTTVRGVSGIDHRVEAILVDDKAGRVVVVAAESNPRIAALMQSDIQQTLSSGRVLVARPIAFDMPFVARKFVERMGIADVEPAMITEWANSIKEQELGPTGLKDLFGGIFLPAVTAFKSARISAVKQVISAAQQLANLDWEKILISKDHSASGPAFSLRSLLPIDSLREDLQLGVCPIPLFELTEADWDLLLSENRIEEIEGRLAELGILQYFFPPRDQLALALADRKSGSLTDISGWVDIAPGLGHPIARSELVRDVPDTCEIIEQLVGTGLLVEGEIGYEVTPAGASQRATVKFRPREGTFSKILQSVSVKLGIDLNLKDILPKS